MPALIVYIYLFAVNSMRTCVRLNYCTLGALVPAQLLYAHERQEKFDCVAHFTQRPFKVLNMMH